MTTIDSSIRFDGLPPNQFVEVAGSPPSTRSALPNSEPRAHRCLA